MRGSLLVVIFFSVGTLIGKFGIIPSGMIPSELSTVLLYILIFQVGVSIGSSDNLKKMFNNMGLQMFLVPVGTIVGTLSFVAAALLIFKWLTLPDTLAVASGFGYYSLSSILITEFKTPEAGIQAATRLGALALLANIARELLSLVFAPLLRRFFGPYGPVAAAGVTSVDVLLPTIIRYSGKGMIPTAIINAFLLELSVPPLVSFFCMF